ncbi:MAG: SDR family NAD(P)-dependent oxidoreductase, partial [Bdellovibrionia bacterium]
LYCASKFALEGFSEALYYELKPYDVQVALVEPGAVKTQFGTNVTWAKRSLDPASPYAFQTANYIVLKDKIGGRAPDTTEVVNRVGYLSRVRKMPLRNFCGNDAKSLRRMMRMMPMGMITSMMSMFYARTFGNRKSAHQLPSAKAIAGANGI